MEQKSLAGLVPEEIREQISMMANRLAEEQTRRRVAEEKIKQIEGEGKMQNLQQQEITREKIELWKRTYCKGANDDELALFLNTCRRTGLAPEARQICMVKRYNSKEERDEMTVTPTIDGFRLVAERTGKYAGQTAPEWCGGDGKWVDVWLSDEPPLAARVGVLHRDFKSPMWGVAKYNSFVQKYFDKKTRAWKIGPIWEKMPELMLAKCAESQALRKAFPQELSGLYTQEEMQQAENYSQEQEEAQEKSQVVLPKQPQAALNVPPVPVNFQQQPQAQPVEAQKKQAEETEKKKALFAEIRAEMSRLEWDSTNMQNFLKARNASWMNPQNATIEQLAWLVGETKQMPSKEEIPVWEEPQGEIQEPPFDELSIADNFLPRELRGKGLTGKKLAEDTNTPWKSDQGRQFQNYRQLIHIWEKEGDDITKNFAIRLLEKYPSKKEQEEKKEETAPNTQTP